MPSVNKHWKFYSYSLVFTALSLQLSGLLTFRHSVGKLARALLLLWYQDWDGFSKHCLLLNNLYGD